MNATVGTPIHKFNFLMNKHVAVSVLAENEAQAFERAKGLFGKKEKFTLVDSKFSHNVGDYSLASHTERKKVSADVVELTDYKPFTGKNTAFVAKAKKPVDKGDLLTNVLDAYAKDKKVDL